VDGMSLDSADPGFTGAATVPQIPCGFCGASFAGELTYCPRCGLPRGLEAVRRSESLIQPPPLYIYPPSSTPSTFDHIALGTMTPAAFFDDQPRFEYGDRTWTPTPTPTPHRRSRAPRFIAAAVIAVIVAAGATYLATDSTDSKIATVAVPSGPGVVYRSSAGNFAARFPEKPEVRTIPITVGDDKATTIVAVDADDHIEVASSHDATANASSTTPAVLRAQLSGFAATSGLTLLSDTVTSYQNRGAVQGEFRAPSGSTFTALVIGYSPTRVYFLVAPTGSAFDDLLASFVAVD
jgi:hypothetical protein